MTSPTWDDGTATWADLARLVAAHAVMLREAGIIDAAVQAAILTALDGVARAASPAGETLPGLIAAFDERLDALVPAAAAGAAAVGRAQADVAAALARLAARREVLALAEALDGFRATLLDFAAANAVVLMPAYATAQPLQPTTFGHFLGGLSGPLARAAERLPAVYAQVNQSPLGAGALAASGLPIERERVAALLGFAGLVTNTFDAVAATDHLGAAAEAAAAAVAPLRRFLVEILTWLRTEPTSFRLADEWLETDPALPQVRAPRPVERLVAGVVAVCSAAATAVTTARAAPYAPATASLETILPALWEAHRGAVHLLGRGQALLSEGVQVNRAYLANRAGRGFTTAGDLAEYLMIEEQLPPGAAREIAAMVIARAQREEIEISHLTPAMLDAAALLLIGRELGVEVESLSRYLAPRRFLERRTATGAPAPTTTRTDLEAERRQLAAAGRWWEDAARRLAAAAAELERLARTGVAES